MAYSSQISRTNPTAYLFLIDESGSMGEKMPSGLTKAEFVADVINRTIMNMIVRCTKAEGVRDYFEVGVIRYSGDEIANALQGPLATRLFNPISALENNLLRLESRVQKLDDGAGGVFERNIRFPVWYEPKASGVTPMRSAFILAAEALSEWCDAHPKSYPPTLLHLTDGESSDGDPEEIAELLKKIGTEDGEVLLFNLHASVSTGESIAYPASDESISNKNSKLLYRMSSVLPTYLANYAKEKGYSVVDGSRGFVYNADVADIAEFFDIGTRPSQLK